MTRPDPALDELVSSALSGQRRELARLISLVESQPESTPHIMKRVYPLSGQAHIVGVTGPPGAGKSTLTGQIAGAYRERGLSVAIVAVDPSSPFSGGALLGDRIRMQKLSGDPGVFVRSMSSRGSLGGTARATADVVTTLDACGYRRILVETVGAGQNDVAVSSLAHTTLLVLMPQMGDEIQTLKAGILESADVLAVNKADLEGAERAAHLLEAMLSLAPGAQGEEGDAFWRAPVITTVATAPEGIEALVDAIEEHRLFLESHFARDRMLETAIATRLEDILLDQVTTALKSTLQAPETQPLLTRLAQRKIDPYAAAQILLKTLSLRSGE